MDKFFAQYADLTALILTFLLPVIFAVWIKRKTRKQTRAIAVWLLGFGPLGILTFIFFHLFENTYRAITGALNGSFIYNFHFYSIILMGVVMAAVAACFFRACVHKCLRGNFRNRVIFYQMLFLVVITAPLLPITPLSAIPLICCVFSLSGLAFVKRKQTQLVETVMLDIQAAAG